VEICHGVRIHTSTLVDGRKVPVSVYYVGRGKDGEARTSTKPHNAALMTEALAGLLVTKLTNTGHHAEVCELFCDENSTVHDDLVGLGEASAPPAAPPKSLAKLSDAIEACFEEGLTPLEVVNHCNKVVMG
jgi:hypothetical protein